ncbi:MAG: hypothetical protein ABIQ58_02870 [Candidatus Limnocylindrales bacterium]
MLPTLITVTLASAPGWIVATLLDLPLLGWPLTVVGVTLALMQGASSTHRSVAAVLPSQLGWLTLQREVARARRNGEELTLIRIDDPADSPISLDAIAAHAREVDVAWHDDAAWLLAVGAGDDGRDALTSRLRRALPEIAAVDAVRSMTFPGDAMTVHALVAGLTRAERGPVGMPVLVTDAVEDMAFGQELTGAGGSGA